MPEENLKGVTVKIKADLHAEVRRYLEEHGMTMAEFVSAALENELHPKFKTEVKQMEGMRTLAFQVPERMFQRIKGYLARNHLTQKDFILGLIETELDREQAQIEHERQGEQDAEESEEDSPEEDGLSSTPEDLREENPEEDSPDEEIEEEEPKESDGPVLGM